MLCADLSAAGSAIGTTLGIGAPCLAVILWFAVTYSYRREKKVLVATVLANLRACDVAAADSLNSEVLVVHARQLDQAESGTKLLPASDESASKVPPAPDESASHPLAAKDESAPKMLPALDESSEGTLPALDESSEGTWMRKLLCIAAGARVDCVVRGPLLTVVPGIHIQKWTSAMTDVSQVLATAEQTVTFGSRATCYNQPLL